MDITGRIILDLPLQQGTSKAGNAWRKKEWVLETFDNFPKKVCFYAFGDRIDSLQLEVGQSYVVSIDIESREYNGKWYTDVKAYAARPYQGDNPPQDQYSQGSPMGADPFPQGGNASPFPSQPTQGAPVFTAPANDSEDLPF